MSNDQIIDAEKKLPSYRKKRSDLAKIIARNQTVFRRLSKSYRRHYTKSHGLR